jgi:3-oxoacyl-[acyl-carrier-protein] synthase-3
MSIHYSQVRLEAFGYELPPHVVTSEDLERRLAPLYTALHLQPGQLEALTGIKERRFWDPGFPMSQGATLAARKALEQSSLPRSAIEMLIYGGVCRDNLEPATACAVAHALELPATTQLYDVSNACLGILNGMLQVANAIELGQISAGLIVSSESARQIVDITIDRMLQQPDMATFKQSVATLTGGSGAIAVVLAHADLAPQGHPLIGALTRHAAQHHRLCTWGPDTGIPASGLNVMQTDAVGVLQNGVRLGVETFERFKHALQLEPHQPDKIICHQVGAAHQHTILDAIGVPRDRDFATYPFLGNIGTVSLPITAAIAEERGFLSTGDSVGFLGIGSGLNCLMLGVNW